MKQPKQKPEKPLVLYSNTDMAIHAILHPKKQRKPAKRKK